MPPAAHKRALAQILIRLVFGVRERVLERPAARTALRVLGWPIIKLMHATSGRAPVIPEAPIESTPVAAQPEPVLRLPLDYLPGPLAPAPRIAVLLHAFHVELLAEMRRALEKIPYDADLYVSTDSDAKKGAIEAAFADWAGAVEVRVTPNRGRNVAPQLLAFRDVYDSHELLLILHTKVSSHTDELAGWREFLLKSLLGSPAAVRGIIEAFHRLPELGVVAPRTFPAVRRHMVWGDNFTACRALAEQLGFTIYPDSPLDFPAGFMFWARAAALRPLLDLSLGWQDFDEEAGQKDGTLAHAVERLIFHACELSGRRWIHAGGEQGAEAPETFWRAYMPRMLNRAVTDQSRSLLLPGRRPRPTSGLDVEDFTAAPEPKLAFRELCLADLEAFLATGEQLVLPTVEAPEVSIILVLYNQAELTFECLRSLAFALDRACEILVVDNASSDMTGELLGRVGGLRVVRNAENLHFLRAVNQAAALARGRHLLLLNNDTRLSPGSIAAAVERLDGEPDLGAVGGRIDLLDGTLQEAGSIIWRDGTCVGYGRGQDPWAPEFQFRRDVDYCSGAFLMTPRALFEELGRLDEAFAPAYYEETDLCMRIREAGRRVSYEPRVRISHFEFGSSATSDAAFALQAEHQRLFAERHAQTLARDHLPATKGMLTARMRSSARGRVLIVEDQIPYPHLGAGYPRALDIARSVAEAGWFVTYYPLVFSDAEMEAAYSIVPREVEIAAERGREGLVRFMRERPGYYDAAVVSRPHNMKAFREALAQSPRFMDLAQVVYDAEAIFAGRDQTRAALDGRDDSASHAEMRDEVALAAGAGAVLAVNALEADNFRRHGCAEVRVLGHALDAEPTEASFEARRDLLFVGALDEDDSPNADSLVFFVQEVMPRLDALIGADWVLRIAGRNGAPKLRALASGRVQFLGRVESLDALYGRSRLFIAPTRYAAGIPMKVHEAAARGLPVAATSLLARQLGWKDGVELAVGDTPQDFAAACARLYADAGLWRGVRDAALARLKAECDPTAFRSIVNGALETVVRARPAAPQSLSVISEAEACGEARIEAYPAASLGPAEAIAWTAPRVGGTAVSDWTRLRGVDRGPILVQSSAGYVWPQFGVVADKELRVFRASVGELLSTGRGLDMLEPVKATEHVARAAVFMPHGGLFNYGHFLLDGLTSLVAIEKAELLEGRTVLSPELKSWQRGLIQLAFPGLVVHETKARVVSTDDAVWADSMDHYLHRPGLVVNELRERILRGLQPAGATQGKVYLSRRGQSLRPLVNERDLETALRGLGYRIVQPERMSIGEQVALFQNGEVVVSASGAGLANALFAGGGTTIVEILPSNFAHPWVRDLCVAVGCDWRGWFTPAPLDAKPGDGEAPNASFKWRLDVPAFVAWLQAQTSGA